MHPAKALKTLFTIRLTGTVKSLFLLSLFLISCNSLNQEEEIVGEWKVNDAKIESEFPLLFVESIDEVERDYTKDSYRFDEKGNYFVESLGNKDDNGRWHFDKACDCIILEPRGVKHSEKIKIEASLNDPDSLNILITDGSFGTLTLNLSRK